jgi:hypothetical protein
MAGLVLEAMEWIVPRRAVRDAAPALPGRPARAFQIIE